MRTYFVYILASRTRRLYTGISGNLPKRMTQHRHGEVAFTAKYRIHRLVYAQGTTDARQAIAWEKQIKGWSRQKKIALITAANPTWDDLLPGEKQIPRYARDDKGSG